MSPETAEALEIDGGVGKEVERSNEKGDHPPPSEKEVHCRVLPELLVNADLAHVAPDRSFKAHDDRSDIAGKVSKNRGLVCAADLAAHVHPLRYSQNVVLYYEWISHGCKDPPEIANLAALPGLVPSMSLVGREQRHFERAPVTSAFVPNMHRNIRAAIRQRWVIRNRSVRRQPRTMSRMV
jgi:hypothetical protein